ncbi:hypothetical protein V8E36_008763 [Tilletia maclaganii]
MPVADATSQRPLFGGAIVADVPTSWRDVSDFFRQVPDNQEVFVSPDSDPTGEASLIVEVLQRVEAADPEAAVRYHFDSIAHDNSAEDSQVLRTWTLNGSPSPILLSGTQHVKKFGKASEPAHLVRIWVALWRIEEKNIDLVMSVNATAGEEEATDPSQHGAELQTVFERAARTLEIRDYGLFA